MTEERVRQLIQEYIQETEDSLVRLIPKLTTKEACEELKCSSKWLRENKDLFDAEIVNLRNDLRYSTVKVLRYKKLR